MRTVTRSELVEAAALQTTNLNTPEVKAVVEMAFDEIGMALGRGEAVKVSRFGTFVPQHKGVRMGRNPKRPEREVAIAPHTAVKFHAAQELKETVDRGMQQGRADSSRTQQPRRRG